MSYTKTDFNEGAAPGISAAELDKIGDGIEAAYDIIETGLVGSITVVTLTDTYQASLSETFTKPAAWTSYDLLAICSTLLRDAGGSSAAGIFIKLSLDGLGNAIARLDIKDQDYAIHVVQHRKAGITGDAAILVEGKMTVGDQGKIEFTQVSYIAIRKS